MYKVTKIVTVVLEKHKELETEEIRAFYKKGYFIQRINYYVANELNTNDKEKIRNSDLIVIIYKNKISDFGQKVIKYSAIFDKKIIIKQNIELADL